MAVKIYNMNLKDNLGYLEKKDLNLFRSFVSRNFSDKYILNDEKFLDWQYGLRFNKGYFKGDFSIAVLKEGDNILGYLGILPLKYKVFDKSLDLSVYANLIVDPRIRSLGLGTILMDMGMNNVKAASVLGYNPQTVSIYNKLGDWREVGNLNRFVAIYNSNNVDELLNDQKLDQFLSDKEIKLKDVNLKGLSFSYEDNFSGEFDIFWNNIRDKYLITIERSSEYLNWRYSDHPYLDYKVLACRENNNVRGYVIFRFEEIDGFKIARIIDFVVDNKVENLFVSYLNNVFLKEGADMADFLFTGDYYKESFMNNKWFLTKNTEMSKYPILFNPVHRGRFDINFMAYKNDDSISDSFYNFDSWFVTKGDGDQDRPNPH